jgi:hypothetical protein
MRDARFSYLLGGAVTRKYIINLEWCLSSSERFDDEWFRVRERRDFVDSEKEKRKRSSASEIEDMRKHSFDRMEYFSSFQVV